MPETIAVQVLRAAITSIQKTRSNADEAGVLNVLEWTSDADLVMKLAEQWQHLISTDNVTPMDAMNAIAYLKMKSPFGEMLGIEMLEREMDAKIWENPILLLM